MGLNRYENISQINQIFINPETGDVITMLPGGTAVDDEKSSMAKSRFTKLVTQNVKQQAAEEEEEEKLETPVHANENPTNTVLPESKRLNDSILTDEFDGAGDRGAVNTSAAPSELVSEIAEKVGEAADGVLKDQKPGANEIRSASSAEAVEKGRRSNRK